MKKLMMIGFVMAFLALLPTTTQADVYEFIADQIADVGDVTVTNDGANLYIGISTINTWWALQDTHVHIWEGSIAGIPQKNGNPIPGQFAFSVPDSNGPTFADYTIPLIGELPGEKKKDDPVPYNWAPGDVLYLGVHGVVGICDCENFNDVLPDEVEAEILYPGTESYFVVTIAGDSIMAGTHKGWCADADDLIEGDETHLGDIYSTICEDIEDIPETAIIYDSNLPSVNWLLNNWEAPYTAGDVQYAIWIMLSGHVPADLSGLLASGGKGWPADQDYDETRALELVAAAEDNDDFFPACGEVMAVVVIPPLWEGSELPRQSVLIEIPAPCCETAWGAMPGGPPWGLDFPGKNWALYITYTVEAP